MDPQVPPKQQRGVFLPFRRKDRGVKYRRLTRFKHVLTIPFKQIRQARLLFLPFKHGVRVRLPFLLNGLDGRGYPSFLMGWMGEVVLHF